MQRITEVEKAWMNEHTTDDGDIHPEFLKLFPPTPSDYSCFHNIQDLTVPSAIPEPHPLQAALDHYYQEDATLRSVEETLAHDVKALYI